MTDWVRGGKKKVEDDFETFVLNNWKNRVAINSLRGKISKLRYILDNQDQQAASQIYECEVQEIGLGWNYNFGNCWYAVDI